MLSRTFYHILSTNSHFLAICRLHQYVLLTPLDLQGVRVDENVR